CGNRWSARGEFHEPQRGLPHRTLAREHADAFAAPELVGVALDGLELVALAADHQPRVSMPLAGVDAENVARLHLARIGDGGLVGEAPEAGPAGLLPHVMYAGRARHRRGEAQLARRIVETPDDEPRAPRIAAGARIDAGSAQILVDPRSAVGTQRLLA